MKLPLRWLAEWIDLPWPAKEPLDAFVERLTIGGLEIEEVLHTGPDLAGFAVGRVLERKPHPDADRLSLCSVDVGQAEPLDIVCGAPNVAAGQTVAVALHGATLPDGTKIKRSKIRGVTSNGMICSAKELALSEESEGILVLASGVAAGTPLADVLSAGEVVLDVAITPNRGDWVSVLGMAREVRAHYGGTVRIPPCDPTETPEEASRHARVHVDDAAGCPRYVARIVRGVTVAPSPAWLQDRLAAAGLRPINNVVDVTNLVLLELGQPLHAFDLAQIRGGEIRVRSAQPGEKLATLDGSERALAPEDLVIADAERALAVAGVMGGAASEVRPETRDVLIESAQFHPSRVRRTARRLGLHTDASYRFERGVDPEGVARAADRAARLLAELAGGTVCHGRVEARGEALPRTAQIALRPDQVNRLLGTALKTGEIGELLSRVDVAAQPGPNELLLCRPPSWRADLAIPEDLIEEVGRIYGFDRIEATLPGGAIAGSDEPPQRTLREHARDALRGAGLVELMTFPALRPGDLDGLRLPADDPRRATVEIVNPIQAEEAALRPTLVPSLLRAAQLNLARQAEGLQLFEVGRAFLSRGGAELPREAEQAAALWVSDGGASLWDRRDVPLFFRAKGAAERVLAELGYEASFQPRSAEPYLHPGASGELRVGNRAVAALGELHPETAAAFGIDAAAALLILDLEALLGAPRHAGTYRELSRHPKVRRDLAVLLDRSVAAGDVVEWIRKTGGGSLQSVTIFDRYEGRGVPEEKVSVAFRLEFQRTDRTLTDAEVSRTVERIVKELSERFGGELR
jgi:phenylalanyl-tRNA synthetase beta chain